VLRGLLGEAFRLVDDEQVDDKRGPRWLPLRGTGSIVWVRRCSATQMSMRVRSWSRSCSSCLGVQVVVVGVQNAVRLRARVA